MIFSNMNFHTPNRGTFVGSNSPLERSLILNQNRREFQKCCFWGLLNVGLLFLLIYDVNNICPLYVSYYNYIEYGAVVVFTLNVLYYIFKIIKISFEKSEPIQITQEQKRLLKVKDSDPNYKIIDTPLKAGSQTLMDTSAISWRSNISQNDSMNYSLSSSWTYMKPTGTPEVNVSHFSNKSSPAFSPLKLSYQDAVESITDENALNKYLKEHETVQPSPNLLSSFWTHPVTKSAKDMSTFLKKCQYQLSTITPVKACSPSGKEDTSPGQITALEVWTRINVDSVALTQWNENLRKWISQTILERLVGEFDRINSSLAKHGLTDVKVGSVGLERLRKTAHMVPIAQFIPSLATLLPFLEVTSNQEYLVKRITELARGGCMSEFKWNGGSSYNGKDWDDSLPTDCAIIMHLLASYLDTQLMPLPNMPDTKAFSGHHYIKVNDKMPALTPSSLFIHQVSEKPPHYRVIVGEKVYEMIKGYNNLFHSILFFIYHVNKMEHGMLGRVNLGKAGINILWVIDQ